MGNEGALPKIILTAQEGQEHRHQERDTINNFKNSKGGNQSQADIPVLKSLHRSIRRWA